MATKTMHIDTVIDKANAALANWPIGKTPEEIERNRHYRFGLASLLESILHDTGNYKGFGYLDTPYREGITDESRRHYYR